MALTMRTRPARALTAVSLLAAATACLAAAPSIAAPAALDQTHGLRGTRRLDAGLYTAYCPRRSGARVDARVFSKDAAVQPGGVAEAEGAQEGSGAGEEGQVESDEGAGSAGDALETAGEGLGDEAEGEALSSGEAAGAQETIVFASEGGAVARAASTSETGWPAKQCLKMDKGRAGRSHTLVGLDGVHNWLLGGYGNDTIIGGNSGDVIWADYHPSGEPPSQTAVIKGGNGRNVIYANDTRDYVWTGTNSHTVVHAHVSGISGVIHCQSPGIVVFLSTVSERHFKLDGCRHISHYSVGY